MSSKRRSTMAKEILDQARIYFNKQGENLTVTHTQECQRKPSENFEPTPNFSKVFSETVGKRTELKMNIHLKDNPRLISPSDKSTKKNREDETADIAQTQAQEFEQKPLEKLEPSANFHKLFSDMIGKDRPSVNIKLKDNPRLVSLSNKHPESDTQHNAE